MVFCTPSCLEARTFDPIICTKDSIYDLCSKPLESTESKFQPKKKKNGGKKKEVENQIFVD